MKRYKDWEESGKDLDEFLTPPCEIDEDLYLHLAETTTPSWQDANFLQIGEADGKTSYGTFTFSTIWMTRGKYIYLGVLPSFKGSEYDYYDDIDKEGR